MRKKFAIFCAAAMVAMTMTACGDGVAQKKMDDTTEAAEMTDAPTESMEEGSTAEAGASAAAGGSYKDGEYTAETVGASEAGSGTVKVTVTIKDGKIEEIAIDAPKDQASLGAQAIKKLPGAMIEAQSAEVDKVAGASKTSAAIIEAVTDCLAQASK
jgi:uncharacterized protein with FMN-binding domain